MSKRANPFLIGIFLIGAIMLVIAGLFTFGSKALFTPHTSFIMYFDQTVNGLELGAAVKFKGVQIGQVDEIRLYYDEKNGKTYIPVIVKVDRDSLRDKLLCKDSTLDITKKDHFEQQIEKGLRAKVSLQSYVTGLLYVDLNYYPKTKPDFLSLAKSPYWEIPTVESEAEEIMGAASNIIKGLQKIDFSEIGERVSSIVKNLDEGIKEIQFKKINDDIIAATDSAKGFFDDGKKAMDTIGAAANEFKDTFDPDSIIRYDLAQALREVSGAARSIRDLADFIERNPRAFLSGKMRPSEKDMSCNLRNGYGQ